MGEAKAVALVAIAYGMLACEDYSKHGFINKKVTRLLNEIKEDLRLLISSYELDKKEIDKKVTKILQGVKKHNKNYLITTEQTAMDILYHVLEPVERTFKKHSDRMIAFWEKNREKVLLVSYSAHDTAKYWTSDYDSDQAAWLHIQEALAK